MKPPVLRAAKSLMSSASSSQAAWAWGRCRQNEQMANRFASSVGMPLAGAFFLNGLPCDALQFINMIIIQLEGSYSQCIENHFNPNVILIIKRLIYLPRKGLHASREVREIWLQSKSPSDIQCWLDILTGFVPHHFCECFFEAGRITKTIFLERGGLVFQLRLLQVTPYLKYFFRGSDSIPHNCC